jgi:hypothetical protein
MAGHMARLIALAEILALLTLPVVAQERQLPTRASLGEAAARRFPQPVRVGALLGRQVLQPLESQPVLGRVRGVIQRPDGTLDVIVRYGGIRGYFGRPIAVPLEAVALLGEYIEIVGYTPEQLSSFHTFDGAGATSLPANSQIQVGLARPSH